MSSDKRVVQIFRRAVNKAKNVNRLAKAGSSVEGFFASKGAAYAIPDGDFARKASLKGGELQSHLQGMVNLIRDEDTMRLVVKVESEATYTRYLCIVTTYGLSDEEESVVLGFDWIEDKVTLGLVIPLWSNVSTKLDGDGGFEIKTEHHDYIFKPVSVQTLWTALSWIHKCLHMAHRAKHFDGGLSHAWLDYYQSKILSPEECINFWKSMKDLENRRDISFSCFDKVKTDEELLKGSIRNKLKEILTRFDLEEVTCRQVREALEAEMKMSLQHLKGYVDEQLFVILGQMESSSKITDHLYLGSEWNACNLQELKDNGVAYILNITKEVDNFFPGTFEYMNIRIYDIKEADLLRHWGKTYRFIHKAKERGSATLVHCRRGISRSASTVVAYIMKENNMSLSDAMKFVKSRRSIVQPNSGFWKQLIIYEGILKSSRNRHNTLFRRRSNSESGNIRRPHKKGRHKNSSDVDHVDSTPEHAHTLPRMSNEVSPEGEGGKHVEGDAMASPEEPEESGDEESPDFASSEDISSNSDEEPTKNKLKIRRTVSEPAMMRLTSPTRKPRAQTLSDQLAGDDARSPTGISEDVENEETDAIWIDMVKEHEHDSEEMLEVSNQEAETKDLPTEERLMQDKSDISLEEMQDVSEENVEETHHKTPEADDSRATKSEDTRDSEQVAHAGEAATTEFSGDVEEVPCEESPRVESLFEESPRVETSLEGSPREGNSDYEVSPRTPRQRSRSIGEKLEDKLLLKQGRSDSSDNLKKVNVRGRVRRRERRAKSDLQISSSGFVKRHTQIIEEQMLYSLLMNSDKTLATLSVDFWDSSNLVQDNSTQTIQNSVQDLGTDLERGTVETSMTDSENNSVNQLEDVKVFMKNSKNFEELHEKHNVISSEEESSCEKNNLAISEKDNPQYSQIQFGENCERTSSESLAENSQAISENCSGEKRTTRLASQELQEIVQKVNAEAKQDLKTQGDILKAPVISQKELRQSNDSEDICIDEMRWIDLTHHHGDVVKRRSAAFENSNAKTESCSRKQGTKTSLSQPCDDQEVNTRQVREYVDDTKNSGTSSLLTNIDVPKLDLDELTEDEYSMPRSNSIIVEDYNSWESSSVRDRTRILEGIIAKTGGSFPSPRSRAPQSTLSDSEVKNRLQQEMNELNIDTGSKTEECCLAVRDSPSFLGTTSEQPAEDDVFGDAPVKNLVGIFEGKNEGSE